MQPRFFANVFDVSIICCILHSMPNTAENICQKVFANVLYFPCDHGLSIFIRPC